MYSSKILLMEIGDEEQARRVLELVAAHQKLKSNRIELWRDFPDQEPEEGKPSTMHIEESFTHLPCPSIENKTKEEVARIESAWKRMRPEQRGIKIKGFDVPIRGTGKIRSVVLFRVKNFGKTEREMLPIRLEDVMLCHEDIRRRRGM